MTAGLAIQATTGLSGLPISPWAGLGVLAAWAAAALLAGGLLLRLRDAGSARPTKAVAASWGGSKKNHRPPGTPQAVIPWPLPPGRPAPAGAPRPGAQGTPHA